MWHRLHLPALCPQLMPVWGKTFIGFWGWTEKGKGREEWERFFCQTHYAVLLFLQESSQEVSKPQSFLLGFQRAVSFVYLSQHLPKGGDSEDSIYVKSPCSDVYSLTQTFIEGSMPGSKLGVDGKAQKEFSNHGQQSQKLRNASALTHHSLSGLVIMLLPALLPQRPSLRSLIPWALGSIWSKFKT